MHGRLKVKTTAEQEAEKQKERQKKLALYTAGCQKAMEKRNLKEFDVEALAVTGQLLQNNPDHYTLWNFRKETILSIISEKSENKDEVQDLLENELLLTESCLRKNPKSYGAWHHRKWSLKAMPNPNWRKEIYLLEKYLQVDERNFHCWDHRRFVCSRAENESPEDELSFTLKKIEENFSNYSAWHYRSSLLPLVHPGKNAVGPRVDQETLHKEYELVQNAAFTDPNDQSAWFYHRWLLGRAAIELCLLCCHLVQTHKHIVVVFSKPIKKGLTDKITILVDDSIVNSCWKSPEDNDYASIVWYCALQPSVTISEDTKIKVTFENESEVDSMICTSSANTVWKEYYKNTLYSFDLSAVTTEVLEQELESCQQLLDMEPDNKWTLLTCVLLLRALNSVSHEEAILKYLDNLVKVDAPRRHYYWDLRSRCLIENNLTTFLANPRRVLDLSHKQLTLFCHAGHLIFLQHLDLSNNRLTALHSLRNLFSLQELVLDHNEIEDCSGLEALTLLQTLSVNHNAIKHFDCLSALKSCENLQSLSILDNPLSRATNFTNELKKFFPSLKSIN